MMCSQTFSDRGDGSAGLMATTAIVYRLNASAHSCVI